MTEKDIKAQVVKNLPAHAFKNCPQAAWLLLPIVATLFIGHFWLLIMTPAWFISIPIAVILGSTQLTLWSFAHEAAHGTIVRNKGFRRLCTNLAGLFFLYPGELLERWHMAHHRHTNQAGEDPDVITVQQFSAPRYWLLRALMNLRVLNNFVYFLFANTVHANVILWFRTDELKSLAGASWIRLRCQSLLIVSAWVILSCLAGPTGTIFGFVLPWIIGNTLWASYALTNHSSSPLTKKPDLFNTTVSVTTYRVVERLHLNGSHHLEHHLFPRMNWRYLPLVRAELEKIAGERFRTVGHWQSVKTHLSRPMFYADPNTKANFQGKQRMQLEI